MKNYVCVMKINICQKCCTVIENGWTEILTVKKSHCSYGLKLKDLGLLTEASNGVQQEI